MTRYRQAECASCGGLHMTVYEKGDVIVASLCKRCAAIRNGRYLVNCVMHLKGSPSISFTERVDEFQFNEKFIVALQAKLARRLGADSCEIIGCTPLDTDFDEGIKL